LCLSVLSPSHEGDVVVSFSFSNSVHWESRDNVEWSVHVESEFVIYSCLWNWFCFINIDDSPSLVCSSMLVPNNNISSFFIFSSMDINCLIVSQVDEVFSLIDEDLPPVRVGACDLHVLASTIALNVP